MSYLSCPANSSSRLGRCLIGLIVLVGFLGLSASTARADSFSLTFTDTGFPLPTVSGTGAFTTDGVCVICTPGSGLLTFTASFVIGPPFSLTDVFDITDDPLSTLFTTYNRTLNQLYYTAYNSEDLDNIIIDTNGTWALTLVKIPQTGIYTISAAATPEPDPTILFLAGLLLLGVLHRRRLLRPAHRF